MTTLGLGTAFGALNTPDVLIVPIVEFPPTMPFTFQMIEVFGVFSTVAVNCLVCLTRTVALVGEIVMVTAGGAVTFTYAVLDTSPSGVFTTIGTDSCGVGALPDAVSCVEDTKAVASGAPSKVTTDPTINPAPFTVSVKLPAVTGDGLTDEMLGSGAHQRILWQLLQPERRSACCAPYGAAVGWSASTKH